MNRFFNRGPAGLFGVIATLLALGCEPPPAPLPLTLPSGLNLAALPSAQQGLLRATLAISEGALPETELRVNVRTNTVDGEFVLQNISASSERTLTFKVYGRFDAESAEVALGELVQPITVRPAEDVVIDFGSDARFEVCAAGDDGRCALRFDENRNGRSNIDDLLPEPAGGLGVDPAPQPPFLVTSATQLQFPSGVRLGTFARQLVVLENFGAHPIRILSAAVVGGQGFSLSILDPAGLSVATPSRALDGNAFPENINPAEEVFVAVSFAPVNNFVTTGALFVVAEDSITRVRQTARVKLIANPEGGLRPAAADYVEPVIDGGAIDVTNGRLPVVTFPSGPLHSGEPLTADDVETRGIPHSAARIVLRRGADTIVIPGDLAFVIDVAPGDRFSTALDGLSTDVDLGVVTLTGSLVSDLACATCVSSNSGTSPEAAEFVNTSTSTQRILLVLGRIDDGAALEVVPFKLTATLTRGPEFDEQPIHPATGPLEGGLQVRLRGSGFDNKASVRVGGAEALDVVVATDDGGINVITFTLPAQQGSENPATIVVENPSIEQGSDGQAATLPEGFLYQPPAPVIDELRPDFAPSTGGTATMTISGRFFSARHGPPRVVFRDNARGSNVDVDATFVDPNTLRLLAPASATPVLASTVQVRVHNRLAADVDGAPVEVGSASNGLSFRYLLPEGAAPLLLSVTPAEGATDGDTSVVVAGSGLRAGALVFFDGVEALCAQPADSTTINCRTPARTQEGDVDVVVFNTDGQSASRSAGFRYTISAPAISSVFPARASNAGGTLLVVDGVGFRAGASVAFRQGAALTPALSTRVSATTLLVTTPALNAGEQFLVVTNADSQEATSPFAIFTPDQATPAPTMISVSPGTGDAAGGYEVVIVGQNFSAPRVVFGNSVVSGVFIDRLPPENDQLTVVAPPSPTDVAAVVNIQVSNDDGQSDSQPFVYSFVAASAPRVDSVSPSLLTTNTTSTVTISGQRFDPVAARVLVRGLEMPVLTRSTTRISAAINTRQLPLGQSSLVVENGDGLGASANVEVVAAPLVETPRLISVSRAGVHAQVPGDQVVVFGEHLELGSVTATFRVGTPGIAADAALAVGRIITRTASVVVVEVPALGDGTHFLELAYADLAEPLVLVSSPLEASDPVIAVSSLRTLSNQRTELTILGDALNPAALTAVELIDLGGRVTACIVSSASEGLLRCTSSAALVAGTGYVPRLHYRGTFNALAEVVVVEGVDIGFGDPVGAQAFTGGFFQAPANTNFLDVPQAADAVVGGIDPLALPPTLTARIVVVSSGQTIASGLATPDTDVATVILDQGTIVDLVDSSAGALELRLDVGNVTVAVADVSLFARRVSNVGAFGNPNVTWPLQAAAIAGAFVAGDVNRLVAVHPTEALTLPLAAVAQGSGFRVPSTRVLPIGSWSVCLADQVTLAAPAELCRPLNILQRGAELEPNDVDADATAIALNALAVQTPLSINGTSASIDDDRFFFLAPTGVSRVRVALGGTCAPGLTLRVRARDDASVVASQSVTIDCFAVELDLPAPGQYIVELSGSATYSLSVQEIAPRICGDGIVTENEQCDDGVFFNGNDAAFSNNVAGCRSDCSEAGEPDDVVPVIVAADLSNTFRTLVPADIDRFSTTLSAPAILSMGTVLRSGNVSSNACAGSMRMIVTTPTGDIVGDDVATGNGLCPFVQQALPAGTYFISVSAETAIDIIPYRLFTFTQVLTPVCGNGIIEGGEQCDGTPGCTACVEQEEPNDVIDDATTLLQVTERALGFPAGDVDHWLIPAEGNVVADLLLERLDQQRCDGGLTVALLDVSGAVIKSAATGGANGCPLLSLREPNDTYFIRVAATDPGLVTPYRLTAVLPPRCGNGVLEGDEICDDANINNNDGCDAACDAEFGFDCATAGLVCVPGPAPFSSCGDGEVDERALFGGEDLLLSSTTAPAAVVVGDFDGDGERDDFAALVDVNQAGIEIFFSDAAQVVQGEFIAIANTFTAGIAAGDLDGDGDDDLAITTESPSTVLVFNNDIGVFRLTATLTGFSNAGRDLVVADVLFDVVPDGRADIIAAERDTGIVAGVGGLVAFRNLGNFGFAPAVARSGFPTTAGIAAGDVDADLNIDVCFSGFVAPGDINNHLTCLRNLDGTLDGPLTPLPLPPGAMTTQLSLADVDLDGALDLIAPVDAPGVVDDGVYVFRNQGEPGAATFSFGPNPGGAHNVDVINSSFEDPTLPGPGTDALEATGWSIVGTAGVFFPSAAAFVPDDGNQTLFMNAGSAAAQVLNETFVVETKVNVSGVLLQRFDNGVTPVDELRLLVGGTSVVLPAASPTPGTPFSVDFVIGAGSALDGLPIDIRFDVLTVAGQVNIDSVEVRVDPLPLVASSSIGSVAIGDVDGDHFPDVAVSDTALQAVRVRSNLGDGRFGPDTQFAVAGVGGVGLVDSDDDGRDDLLTLALSGLRRFGSASVGSEQCDEGQANGPAGSCSEVCRVQQLR